MPTSTVFTFQDVLDAVRRRLDDDAQRRYNDTVLITDFVPGMLVQLRQDRPDLFTGAYGTEVYRPAVDDPLCFDDSGFATAIDAMVALIQGSEEESSANGQAALADNLSQRSRRR